MRSIDTPVAKDFQLTWRKMWGIDVTSIMKEDVIDKVLRRTRIVESTGDYPKWPPVSRDPLRLCWHQVSARALICQSNSHLGKHSPR